MQFNAKVFRWLIITLALATLAMCVSSALVFLSNQMVRPPLRGLEYQLSDLAFQIREENPRHTLLTTDDVVIVDIDDASIRRMGRAQLWPRAYDARAIEYVASGNPRAIGIDFLYTEPDTLSSAYRDLLIKGGIRNADETLEALRSDDELASAIQFAGNVYLAYFSEDLTEDTEPSDSLSPYMGVIGRKGNAGKGILEVGAPVLPVEEFMAVARGTGAIAAPTMPDGSVRNYQLLQQVRTADGQRSVVANFPLYILLDQFGLSPADVQVVPGGLELAEGVVIPLNSNGSFRLNWLGSEESIRYISFYKLLEGLVPVEYFEGKFVFFGTSASGLQDLKTVPSKADKMPGVELHAIAMLNMVNNAFIREVSERESLPWFFLTALILTGLFLTIRPLISFVVSVVLVFIEMSGFVLYVIPKLSLVFPVVTLMILTVLCYIISSLYIYFIRERKNRRLRSAFASYVPRDVVDKIARDSSVVRLGGEKKILTVLFSDIRGFTSYSEKLDPEELVSVLNNYLSRMSEAIFTHKGTIDKFIGDAIMAIFGAPIEQPDHADRACEVALDMMSTLESVNRDQLDRGHPPLRIGIGINTGEMTVGNIGSQRRFDYTVIGDAVNLGSRIEGITKTFGVDIMVSDSTMQSCTPGRFIFRELGSVIVKGKDKPVVIFELVGRSNSHSDKSEDLATWRNAFECLHRKDVAGAITHFAVYAAKYPEDIASRYYIQLCEEHLDHPETFSSILKMETK